MHISREPLKFNFIFIEEINTLYMIKINKSIRKNCNFRLINSISFLLFDHD